LGTRRAVMKLLQDAEWSHWSDREIARQCQVGHPLVANIRAQLAPKPHLEEIPDRPRTVEHSGKVYTRNTAAIVVAADKENPARQVAFERGSAWGLLEGFECRRWTHNLANA
jgi:hypothetical protein